MKTNINADRCDPSRRDELHARPSSQKIPENRNGTKTYHGYLSHMVGNNYVSGNVERAMVRATGRQTKKAFLHVEAGTHWKNIPGRFMRALVRAAWVDYGESLDHNFY